MFYVVLISNCITLGCSYITLRPWWWYESWNSKLL